MRLFERHALVRIDWDASEHPGKASKRSLHQFCRRISEKGKRYEQQSEICVAKLLGNRARKLNIGILCSLTTRTSRRRTWRTATATSVQQMIALSALEFCGVHAVPSLRGKCLRILHHTFIGISKQFICGPKSHALLTYRYVCYSGVLTLSLINIHCTRRPPIR